MPKQKKFDQKAEVRKLARERIGTVRPSRPIQPESARKKPKHKKSFVSEDEAANRA